MKRFRMLALLLAAAIVFSGCNMIRVNVDRDGAQVVAVVNGENITKKEVYDTCNQYYGTDYAIGKKVDAGKKDTFKSNLENTLDMMVAQKVTLLKARDAGMYNFTEDEKKDIADSIKSAYESTSQYSDALKKYQEQAKTDATIKPEEKALADAEAALAEKGTTREELQKEYEDNTAYEKLNKSITDPVTPTDAEVQSYYQSMLSSEQTQFDKDASGMISGEMNYGYTILYYPNDTFYRVKHILIPLPDDVKTQISGLRAKNTEADTKAADELRTAELAKIKATADKALADAKAANGDLKKLDELIKSTGDNDPGMASFPDGYLFYPDSTKDYQPEWTAAAKALTGIGQPSALAGTDFGYHILWITKKIAKGIVPLDQVKDKMTEGAKSDKQSSTWSSSVTTWVDTDYKAKIQKYSDRLNN